jgi:hypothetical protein
VTSEVSGDYQRGRYDELVERHKELLQLYQNLLWNIQTSQLTRGAGVHGAQVNVYAGSKIDAKTITWAIGLASVAFSTLAYFVGLVPVAFGVAISVFSVSFGIGLYLNKKKEDKENQPIPRLPNMPKGK